MLPESATSSASRPARQAIFIDVNCADLFPILDARHRSADVILLDRAFPLEHMAAWAMEHSGYDAIHLFSHGADGRLYLGNGVLDCAAAYAQAADLATIGMALGARGSLMVYGCDAARPRSAAFLKLLARLIGAPVTGSSMLSKTEERGRARPAARNNDVPQPPVQSSAVPWEMVAA